MTSDELIRWAALHVKPHWERICSVADRIGRGERLPPPEREVTIPLAGVRADYGTLYRPLRDLFGAILPDPMTLWTIILDAGRVIRAYREDTADGHFVRLTALEPLRPAAAPGWRKTADLRFFEPFARLGPHPLVRFGWRRGSALLAAAARDAIARRWIDFEPAPTGWRRLKHFLRLTPPCLPVPRARIALLGREFTCVLRIGFDPREPITEPAEACDRLVGLRSREVARRIRSEFGGRALALRIQRKG